MQIFCGTDIIEVDRIKDAILSNENFKYKIYTEKEIKDIDLVNDDLKYQRYAGRFAAKEAVYKAMSKFLCDHNLSMQFSDIEVENEESLKRRPKVNILNKEINSVIKPKNVYIDISISHIKDTAVAMCTVQIND